MEYIKKKKKKGKIIGSSMKQPQVLVITGVQQSNKYYFIKFSLILVTLGYVFASISVTNKTSTDIKKMSCGKAVGKCILILVLFSENFLFIYSKGNVIQKSSIKASRSCRRKES